MGTFNIRKRKPRYHIYFYHNKELLFELNGDQPWKLLGYLIPYYGRNPLPQGWEINMTTPEKRCIVLQKKDSII